MRPRGRGTKSNRRDGLPRSLANDRQLAAVAEERLRKNRSPQQISDDLAVVFAAKPPSGDDVDVQVVRLLNTVGGVPDIKLAVPESESQLCSPVIDGLETIGDRCH